MTTKAYLYCQIILLVSLAKTWRRTSIDFGVEKINKYMDQSSTKTGSLLQDAKSLLEANGSLSEAALMLEAAIQKDDLGEGGYEAWILLGDVRTMDEREDAGMRAMAQGVRLAEAVGTPGPGMLVSETRFLDCPGLLTT